MVLRANTRFEGLGGHLSTYASAASLYEVGFNHFFKGGPDGDLVFFQGHAAPGIYARAFLEGRITEEQLDHFRREALWPGGLSSYPHPRTMPSFWQFPTVSMGIGPLSAVYTARFNRYLHARGIKDTSNQRVWAFLGDGEMDEPEAMAGLSLAARDGLDNLTFVVNCNLQRLDGPVRGNGKIIQELEAVFRGAGWHVIKVIWGREWDDLLARDVDGILVNRDERDARRRLSAPLGLRRCLHPRALLRPRPAPEGHGRAPLRRGSDQASTRRARLSQGLRRLYRGGGPHRNAHGHPGQDGEGLDPGPRHRGSQRHPPGQEADRGGAQDLPRPAGAADPGRGPQGSPVLQPGPRFAGDPVHDGAPPGAGRLPSRDGPSIPWCCRRCSLRPSTSSSADRTGRRARPWPSAG